MITATLAMFVYLNSHIIVKLKHVHNSVEMVKNSHYNVMMVIMMMETDVQEIVK